MSRIEELPDDFDESLDLNAAPVKTSLEDTLKAALAGQSSNATSNGSNEGSSGLKTGKNMEEIVNKTPLFMSDLDNAADEDGENIQLEALKALQYEGTKAEIAQGFKDRGNEAIAEKHWQDAREFYSKGLAVLTSKEDQWEKPTDKTKEDRKQRELHEILRVNRAMAQLELKNYRSTIVDCLAVLKLNPKNVKAHYRCGAALTALEKYSEAIDTCEKGLELDKSNIAMQKLLDKAKAAQKVFDARNARRKVEQQKKERERLILATALKARGIKLRGSEKAPNLDDAEIRLEPDPLSPESEIVFPVLLLYPMHEQSDFIKAFKETETIADHLAYIFPLPWDAQGMYRQGSVECYVDTAKGGVIKAGEESSLLELLGNGQTEVIDGLVRIHIVPSALARKWISEVKAKKGG
ncbi:MAG: hypothetical protein Q9227_009391 [Pyrenula ochraceoflavens]